MRSLWRRSSLWWQQLCYSVVVQLLWVLGTWCYGIREEGMPEGQPEGCTVYLKHTLKDGQNLASGRKAEEDWSIKTKWQKPLCTERWQVKFHNLFPHPALSPTIGSYHWLLPLGRECPLTLAVSHRMQNRINEVGQLLWHHMWQDMATG